MADQRLPGGARGRELRKTLAQGEPVLAYASGKGGLLLVATDRRAIIVKGGALATGRWFGHDVSSFGYRQITSIEMRTGAFDGYVEISAGGVQNRRLGRAEQMKASNVVPYSRLRQGAFRAVVGVIRNYLYGAPTLSAPATPSDSAPSFP